jgi:hypothetical protein
VRQLQQRGRQAAAGAHRHDQLPQAAEPGPCCGGLGAWHQAALEAGEVRHGRQLRRVHALLVVACQAQAPQRRHRAQRRRLLARPRARRRRALHCAQHRPAAGATGEAQAVALHHRDHDVPLSCVLLAGYRREIFVCYGNSQENAAEWDIMVSVVQVHKVHQAGELGAPQHRSLPLRAAERGLVAAVQACATQPGRPRRAPAARAGPAAPRARLSGTAPVAMGGTAASAGKRSSRCARPTSHLIARHAQPRAPALPALLACWLSVFDAGVRCAGLPGVLAVRGIGREVVADAQQLRCLVPPSGRVHHAFMLAPAPGGRPAPPAPVPPTGTRLGRAGR